MNATQPTSARQGAKDAFSRLTAVERRTTDLEQSLSKVLVAFNQVLGNLGKAVDDTAETQEALVNLTGPEQVAQAIAELRATKQRQQTEDTKAKVALMVTEGKLLKAEAITGEKNLIVGKEVLKDGQEIPPGYAAIRFQQLKPDFREKMMGKKVGEAVETENGGNFTIQELYEFAPQPEMPATPEQAGMVVPTAADAPPAPTASAPTDAAPAPVAEATAAPAQA